MNGVDSGGDVRRNRSSLRGRESAVATPNAGRLERSAAQHIIHSDTAPTACVLVVLGWRNKGEMNDLRNIL